MINVVSPLKCPIYGTVKQFDKNFEKNTKNLLTQ